MYIEITPSLNLKESVDAFWIFSTNKTVEKFKVLPDTCADLIFDLNQNVGFLSAVMTNYQQIEVDAKSNLVGIRFKSENFGSLVGIPLNETKNLRLDFSEILPRFDFSYMDDLKSLETLEKNVNKLEGVVSRALNESFKWRDELIISVAKNIRLLKGIVDIHELASSYHISLRQLQRRFKCYIGLTIKEFSRIIRFKNAKTNIKTNPGLSLMEIAFNMGYCDHSHMNNEFNRIAGESPSHFR